MKTPLKTIVPVVCLSLAAAAASPLAAQTSPRAGTNVALVDIAAVFKEHPRFNAEMDRIKDEIEQFDAEARKQRDLLAKDGEGLKDLNVGSPDYKIKEAELANRSANLQVQAALKKKDIMEREAQLYYDVYSEVLAKVNEFSQRYNIGLVLRYNSADIDPKDRASVMQGVNRAIVHHQGLDITGAIIRSVKAPGPGGVVPGGTATRPGALRQ